MSLLKRGFAAALAAAMVLTAAPNAAFAEEVGEVSEVNEVTAGEAEASDEAVAQENAEVSEETEATSEETSEEAVAEEAEETEAEAIAAEVVDQLAAAGDTNFTFASSKVLDNATAPTESEAYPTGAESKTPVKTTGTITINKAAGYTEGMFAEWAPVAGADGYVVYVGKSQEGPWDAIDNELVRAYDGYFRADALGLSAGDYYMKVAAVKVKSGEVDEDNPVATAILKCTVTAADRSGFAFTNGKVPGAYNSDGTLKPDAVVLYVTNGNFDSIVTKVKDAKGNEITFTGVQALLDTSGWWKYSKKPLCIRILGTIDKSGFPSGSWKSSAEGLQVKCNKKSQDMNLTIEGVGTDATIKEFGILCRQTQTVELKNFAVFLCKDDCISLDTDNYYTWVHNIDFYYGGTGGDADQAKGDGSLDVKGNSKYQTFSYNHFVDSGKCSLCGMKSESGPNYITYHHNWFDHSDSRHPRIRTMTVHIYNNYYDGNAKYGVGATTGADAFVESNYFRNCKFPMMSSLQGNDVYAGSSKYDPGNYGTFSGEAGGSIKSYNNIMLGSTGSFAPYKADKIWIKGAMVNASEYFDTATHFDAYEAATRDEKVPAAMVAFSGGDTYSNFDTTVDTGVKASAITPVEDVPAVVTKYAGRLSGGDFKYPIADTDALDADYAVDTTLKSKMAAYVTSLKKVGGVAGAAITQTVTVTIDPANGTAKTTQTVEKGASIAKPADPAATSATTDKTFQGWYVGSTKIDFPYTANSTCTITAKWLGKKVTVTYKDGDTVLGTDDIESGTTTNDKLYSQKAGAVLIGWFTDKDCTQVFDATKPVTADVTVYGKWKEAEIVKLTLDYGADLGEEVVNYEKGSSVSKPADKNRAGYEISGWTNKDEIAVEFPFEITADTTIYAAWVEKEVYYDVVVDPNNGEDDTKVAVKKGELFAKPEVVKEGYVLEGFYLDDGTKVMFPVAVNSDISMTAKWTKPDGTSEYDESVSITGADAKGAQVDEHQKVEKIGGVSKVEFSINGSEYGVEGKTGNFVTIKNNAFVMNHSLGYGSDPDKASSSISFTLPEGTVSARVDVTAKSGTVGREIAVGQFDASGNIVEKVTRQSIKTKNVAQEMKFTLPEITDNREYFVYSPASGITINKVEIFYTLVEPAAETGDVTFKSDDTVVSTDKIEIGKSFMAPGVAKEGYTLKGWFVENATEATEFPAVASKDPVVYVANWEKIEEEPGGDQPGGDQPGGDQPGGDQPGGDQPGGDQPGGDQPGGDQPGGDQPGACEHAYGDWVVVKAPEYNEEGLKQHICAKCSTSESIKVDMLPAISFQMDEIELGYTMVGTKQVYDVVTLVPQLANYTNVKAKLVWSMVDENGDAKNAKKLLGLANGKLTAKKGSENHVVTVTATIKGTTDSASVKVKLIGERKADAYKTELSADKTEFNMNIKAKGMGASKANPIGSVLLPIQGITTAKSNKVKWTINPADKAIATVSGTGLVKGKADGVAHVTATLDGQTIEYVVNVKSASVIFDQPKGYEMKVGETLDLTEKVSTLTGTNTNKSDIKWTIAPNQTKYGTVNEDGVVTAVSKGSLVVVAEINGVTNKVKVKVNP